MQGKIYVLLEPITGKVRYVGYTEDTLERRLVGHLSQAKRAIKLNWHRFTWLRSLSEPPIIKQIDSATTLKVLKRKEIWWINYFKKKGCDLTNGTKGGDGMPFGALLASNVARNIKVKQYDLKGNFITTHSSMSKACETVTGSKKGNGKLVMVCRGNRRQAFGFVWRYEEDSFDKFTMDKKKFTSEAIIKYSECKKGTKNPMFGKLPKDVKQSKKVYQYDEGGNLLRVWDCIKDITINEKIMSYNKLLKTIKENTTYLNSMWSFNPDWFHNITIDKI